METAITIAAFLIITVAAGAVIGLVTLGLAIINKAIEEIELWK